MAFVKSIGVLLIVASLVACAQPRATSDSQPRAQAPGQPAQAKRITAAIMGDPPALAQALAGFGIRGVDALEHLVNAGLTVTNQRGTLQPRLAEAVPSLENGLWT